MNEIGAALAAYCLLSWFLAARDVFTRVDYWRAAYAWEGHDPDDPVTFWLGLAFMIAWEPAAGLGAALRHLACMARGLK